MNLWLSLMESDETAACGGRDADFFFQQYFCGVGTFLHVHALIVQI